MNGTEQKTKKKLVIETNKMKITSKICSFSFLISFFSHRRFFFENFDPVFKTGEQHIVERRRAIAEENEKS